MQAAAVEQITRFYLLVVLAVVEMVLKMEHLTELVAQQILAAVVAAVLMMQHLIQAVQVVQAQ
jgi:hypothetical protein